MTLLHESHPAAPKSSCEWPRPRPIVRLIKLAGSVVYYVISEIWRVLFKLAGREVPPCVVVIYYHRVPKVQREGFAQQMDYLLRWTTPLKADARESIAAGARYTVVTADDGWLSFAENAVPELEQRKIPVAVFAVSHKLGQTIEGMSADRLLTEEELRALRSDIVTIGSHSVNHANMTTLAEHDAMRELCDSRVKLSELLNDEVKLFCFPYGAFSESLIRLSREAGYDRVFTGMPNVADLRGFVIGRVSVEPTDWQVEFYLKITGAYRWVPMAIKLKQWIMLSVRNHSEQPEKM